MCDGYDRNPVRKRYVYKVVDIPTDKNAMQTTLNEYGAAGWELVVLSLVDLTASPYVKKIALDDRQSVCAGTACRPRRTTCRDGSLCRSILKPPFSWSAFCVLFTILLPTP